MKNSKIVISMSAALLVAGLFPASPGRAGQDASQAQKSADDITQKYSVNEIIYYDAAIFHFRVLGALKISDLPDKLKPQFIALKKQAVAMSFLAFLDVENPNTPKTPEIDKKTKQLRNCWRDQLKDMTKVEVKEAIMSRFGNEDGQLETIYLVDYENSRLDRDIERFIEASKF